MSTKGAEGPGGPEVKRSRSARKAPGNRGRRRIVKQIAAAVAIILLAGYAGWLWISLPPKHAHIPVRVVVLRGAGLLGIGRLLQQDGVVRSGWAFALYAATHSGGRALKPGRHILSGDMTLDQIMSALMHAEAGGEEISVTIPEGFGLEQIAGRLDAAGVVDRATFLKAARNKQDIAALATDFPLPPDSLEGYLFPDTYLFRRHIQADEVLQAMVLNFGSRFARPYQQEIVGSGHTLHQIVTEASLIEREARAPVDRPKIAGVIENRLRKKMRLDIDATVLYALGHHKPRVTYKDLEVRSPYNTYRHLGLPPGPIANPGLASLLAALHPEASDYFYYVAQPDGTHLFSRTMAEHEAARHRVRLERAEAKNGMEADSGG